MRGVVSQPLKFAGHDIGVCRLLLAVPGAAVAVQQFHCRGLPLPVRQQRCAATAAGGRPASDAAVPEIAVCAAAGCGCSGSVVLLMML